MNTMLGNLLVVLIHSRSIVYFNCSFIFAFRIRMEKNNILVHAPLHLEDNKLPFLA